MQEKNIVWHQHQVSQEMRAKLNNHQPAVLWFTGLSASGKSTLANEVEKELFKLNCHTYLLDGDNIRHGLNRDLGFTHNDRVENIRRMGEVSRLFADAGQIVLTAFISPFKSERTMVRDLLPEQQFIEIFVKTPLEVCEQRDPKGLYAKARAGQIGFFTGISSPYEEPQNPEILLDTEAFSLAELTQQVIQYLRDKQIING